MVLPRAMAGPSREIKDNKGASSGHEIAITPTASWIRRTVPYCCVSWQKETLKIDQNFLVRQ